MSITKSHIRVKGSDKWLLTLSKFLISTLSQSEYQTAMNPLFSKSLKCISQLSNYIM